MRAREFIAESKVLGYHGTNNQFSEFDLDYSVEGGFWFSSSIAHAKKFGERVISAELTLSKPLVIPGSSLPVDHQLEDIEDLIQRAKSRGYDSVKITGFRDAGVVADSYIAFHPSQIKILRDITESDEEHQQALDQTGFWGRAGAGCLILARDTGRICIAHRGQYVEQPNTWGTWGGAIDQGEDPKQAAARELREEAGYHGKMSLIPLYVFSHPSGFKYYNFLAVVEQEFAPSLDWETQGYKWFEFGHWPKPLHPGMVSLLSDPASIEVIAQQVSLSGK